MMVKEHEKEMRSYNLYYPKLLDFGENVWQEKSGQMQTLLPWVL